jgi:hypothetical protein
MTIVGDLPQRVLLRTGNWIARERRVNATGSIQRSRWFKHVCAPGGPTFAGLLESACCRCRRRQGVS